MIPKIQVPIGNMPIHLVCALNGTPQGGMKGTLAFVRVVRFTGITDDSLEDAVAMFDEESFSIGEECFEYDTLYEYKEIPLMLRWLQAQNLQMPEIVEY